MYPVRRGDPIRSASLLGVAQGEKMDGWKDGRTNLAGRVLRLGDGPQLGDLLPLGGVAVIVVAAVGRSLLAVHGGPPASSTLMDGPWTGRGGFFLVEK